MAKKAKDLFICAECGNEFPRWSGQCPSCGVWNSLKEVTSRVTGKGKKVGRSTNVGLSSTKKSFDEVIKESDQKYDRMRTGFMELDRVLSGQDLVERNEAGLVPGGVILLAGEPGIGKSTLLGQLTLQMAGGEELSVTGKSRESSSVESKVLYVTGEESVEQVGKRLKRLMSSIERSFEAEDWRKIDLVSSTSVEEVQNYMMSGEYRIVIVDSIQTMEAEGADSSAGSVGQVKESSARLIQTAKERRVGLILVGHVTKEGSIAGPRLLEHMVDVVLWFEGDRSSSLRVLRGVKNRYGPTNEAGIFEMRASGLVEVKNPSEWLVGERQENVPGSVVGITLEGTRPLLVEIQALVVSTQLAMPRRVASGFDYNRLQTLVAVLSRRLGVRLGDKDVYVNVVGGLKITDPGVDTAVCMAIISSVLDKPVPFESAVMGEVGLLGEVRKVRFGEDRYREAKRLGYSAVLGPEMQVKGNYVGLKNLKEMKKQLLG